MGLATPNTKLRTREYWSSTLSQAVKFGTSPLISGLYEACEKSASQLPVNKRSRYIMPDWAMTFPGGQLTGVSRCSRYAENVRRWSRLLGSGGQSRDAVKVLGIKSLNDKAVMKNLLKEICKRLGVARGR